VLAEARRGAHEERGFFGWQLKQLQGRYTLAVSSQGSGVVAPAVMKGIAGVCRLRSIRFNPFFHPYLKNVKASPSGCCRSGQARTIQASTILEIRIERI
jgi:hypothetical protein